jgi:hypothetical protein
MNEDGNFDEWAAEAFARKLLLGGVVILVVSHPGYEKRIPKLTSNKNLRAAMTLRRADRSIRAALIRERVRDQQAR